MSRAPMDTVIGIAGAIAIVFTLIGVFAYEYNASPDDSDGSSMDDGMTGIPSESADGSLANGESAIPTFRPSAGVTAISVTIEWTPTAPSMLAPLAGMEYSFADADGTVLESGSTIEDVSFSIPQPRADDYTMTLTAPGSSAGGDYVVTVTYDY